MLLLWYMVIPNTGKSVHVIRCHVNHFREVHFKPYRALYEVVGNHVVVLACFDGRRDLQLPSERRLLR